MIFIEKTEVYGWEAAIRGMRNSYNSWDKSDSSYSSSGKYELGNADIELMDRLSIETILADTVKPRLY